MNKNNLNLNKLINDALAIEAEEAKQAGTLGYMARVLTQATIPHKKVIGNEFNRSNGLFTLSILAPSKIGLPYGTIPRLLLSWLTTEAVKTKEREIVLGHNLSKFMSQIDLVPTGGRWGTITRLRDQMQKLFSASVSCTYGDGKRWAIKNVQPISKASLWWDPKILEQEALFESTVTLSKDFFEEITDRPVPIDIRVLKALSKSPLALDIYCWLTYRMSYLKQNTSIPWEALQAQFGADYASNSQGLRDFKRAFLREVKKVHLIYPEANLNVSENGFVLKPSKLHISKK